MPAAFVMLGNAGDTEASVRDRLQTGLESWRRSVCQFGGFQSGLMMWSKRCWKVRAPLVLAGADAAENHWHFGRYGGIPFLGLPAIPVSAMLSF